MNKNRLIDEILNCNRCPQKPTCKKLCPPVERYAAQDEIEPGMEKPLPPEIIGIRSWPKKPNRESTAVQVLKIYFAHQHTQQEIAKMLGISKQYVSKLVRQAKKTIAENIKKQAKIG
jgi:hypothetical protein